MTAVDLDALDKLRGALWSARGTAVDDVDGLPFEYPLTLMPDELADALLPVVDRIANERAAAELRARARMVDVRAAEEEGDVEDALSEVAAWLRARSAALDPT